MHTMLIRPTKQQLADFGKPDFVIYNAGAFPANSLTSGMGSKTSVDLSIEDNEMMILGTEYAGEMKKAVFTLANYLAPKRGILSIKPSSVLPRVAHESVFSAAAVCGAVGISGCFWRTN
jgi:phosphoenolpyruvate carboxykinase (ATP)